MKNKFMRALALILATCMLSGCLTGCGSEKKEESSEASRQESSQDSQPASSESVNAVAKEGYPIVAENESLSVVTHRYSGATKGSDSDIHNEIAELTNVSIDWELIEGAAWGEKKALVLSRSELPDVLLGSDLSDAEYLNMVAAGQLVAIDEYLEYAPNFCTVLENSPGLKEAITASDGHIYAFPKVVGYGAETYSCMVNNVSYINQAWLDKLGLEMPKTTDDLKKVLAAFVTKDPNGNGIADEVGITKSQTGDFDDWFGAFGIVPSANELGVKNLTVMNGEVVHAATQDEYRAALDFFHELWVEGLIDPEAFTQDSSMYNAKLKAETRVAGMFSCWRGTSWRLSNEDTEYAILPVLTGPDGDQLYPQRYSGLETRAQTMITTDCENIELAMRWVDTLCDPTYAYQFWTGMRIGYHIADNGGATYEVLRPADKNDPKDYALTDFKMTCVDSTTVAKKPLDPDPLNVDNEKAVSDAMYKPYFPDEYYPNVFLTIDEASRTAELTTDLTLYMEQFYADWIINGGDDDDWAAHLKQLKQIGVEEWVKIYADAWGRVK